MASILAVDDDRAQLAMYESILVAFGHSVMTLSDGRRASETARRRRPDVILLDLQMPLLGGVEVLRRLRSDARTALIPVVMISASGYARELAHDLGVDGFLAKPFDCAELLRTVERFAGANEVRL